MYAERLSKIALRFVAVGLLLGLSIPAISAIKPKITTFKAPLSVQIGAKTYHMAVAATPKEQEQGLMHQTQLPERTGMLFPIEPHRRVAFWMKNTLIPLDMLFIENNQVIQIVHNATPCRQDPCNVYQSEQPVDGVIELFGGTAAKDGLKPGSSVKILWLR